MDKSRFGLIGLTAELYREKIPGLMPKLKKLSGILRDIISEWSDIIFFPLVCTKDEVENAFSTFLEHDIDGVILVFLSYSPSLIILPSIKKYKFPLLIWNTQLLKTIPADFSYQDILENHGMHGVQDLASVLKRESISFSLVTGHFEDNTVKEKIHNWCKAASAFKLITKARVGRIGGIFKDMGDFAIEDRLLKKRLGPEVINIPIEELAKETENTSIDDSQINEYFKKDKENFSIEVDRKTYIRSIKIGKALRKIVKEKNLQALTLNFSAFTLKKNIETIPFLEICKLIADGYGYGGEGDVYSATAVLLLHLLSENATFVEMFTTDYENSLIFMKHMGEGNPALARGDYPVRVVKLDLSLAGCYPAASLDFTLRPGKVTMLNLCVDENNQLKFICSLLDIVDRPPLKDTLSPHFFVKPACKVEDFLTYYSLEGGTHHSALTYGDLRERLKYFSRISEIPLVEI